MTGMLTMVLDPCKMVKVCNTFDAGNDVILVDQDSEVVAAVAIITSILFGGRYYNGAYGPYGMIGGFYGMGIIMPIIGGE